MECHEKGNRITVIVLYEVGMETNIIIKIVSAFGIRQMFIYRDID